MNLHCIKYWKLTNNNNNIKIKQEIEGKTNLYSHYIDCPFKRFDTNDNEDLNDLAK